MEVMGPHANLCFAEIRHCGTNGTASRARCPSWSTRNKVACGARLGWTSEARREYLGKTDVKAMYRGTTAIAVHVASAAIVSDNWEPTSLPEDEESNSSISDVASGMGSNGVATVALSNSRLDKIEGWVENRIFNCRFFTLMAVVGSLLGAALCFIKGCIFVGESINVFVQQCLRGINTGKVIMLLVEALDVYLIGTVMLIFGMGLYELFVDTLNLPSQGQSSELSPVERTRSSSLFGLFPLKTRPKWLEINSLDEMKTKLGHVIVMVLLVSLFEKSKRVLIASATDLFLFSASIALASACLYLLAKLHPTPHEVHGAA